MMIKIESNDNADKFIAKLFKSDKKSALKIMEFLEITLPNYEYDPRFMPNAKHLKGYDDNRYRWRIG